MKSCSNIPNELILATTDPKLYDAQNNKWLWKGQMYWAVDCLKNTQTTVSDNIVPNINPAQYHIISENPTQWDYCNSKHCNNNSDSLHVIFTFNPTSTNPNDYLQYVINVQCEITDYPLHNIKDAEGNDIYINIMELSKMNNTAYVEIWIAGGKRETTLPDNDIVYKTSTNYWLIALIILMVLMLGIFIMFIIVKSSRQEMFPPEMHNIAIGNIG